MSNNNDNNSCNSKSYLTTLWEKWQQFPKNIWGLGLLSCFMQMGATMVYTTDYIFVMGNLFESDANFLLMRNLTESASKLLNIPSGYISDRCRNRKLILWIGYGSMFFIKLGFVLCAIAIKNKTMTIGSLSLFYIFLKSTDRVLDACRDSSRDALISETMEYTDDKVSGFGMRKAIASVGSIIGGLLTWGLLYYFNVEQWQIYSLSLIPIALSNYFLYTMVDNVYETKNIISCDKSWNISWANVLRYMVKIGYFTLPLILQCIFKLLNARHVIDITPQQMLATVIASVISFYNDYNWFSTIMISNIVPMGMGMVITGLDNNYLAFAYLSFGNNYLSILTGVLIPLCMSLYWRDDQLGFWQTIKNILIDLLFCVPIMIVLIAIIAIMIRMNFSDQICIWTMHLTSFVLSFVFLYYRYGKNNPKNNWISIKQSVKNIMISTLLGVGLYGMFYLIFGSEILSAICSIIVGSFIRHIANSEVVHKLRQYNLTHYYITMVLIIMTLLGTVTKSVYFTYGQTILKFNKLTTVLMFVFVYISMCLYSFIISLLDDWKLTRSLIMFTSHIISHALMVLCPNRANLFIGLALEGVALSSFDAIFKTWIVDTVQDSSLHGLIFGIYGFVTALVQIITAILIHKWTVNHTVNGHINATGFKNIFLNTMFFQISALVLYIIFYIYKQCKQPQSLTKND